MKKMRYFPVVLMLGLLVFLTSSTEPVGNQNDFAGRRGAQFHRGMHRGMNNGMNFRMFSTLTQEQKDQIKTIRTAQMKKALSLRNQINEQKAKLRTLTTGDKIDTKSAQKVLAKIEGLKTELAKQMVRNRLDIRNVLTEEQRIMFDARSSKMGQKGNGFKGKGRHGMKQGFGQGRPMPCAGRGGRGMQQGQRGMRQGQKGMGNGMTAGKGMRPGMKGGQGMMAGKGMGAGMKGKPGMMGAQRGMQGQTGLAWMKDLTQEQKDQLKALRLQEMKAMTRYKNQLDEYKAKLKTLTTSDNVNLKDVDNVIDQMGEIKLEMAKNKLSNRMSVRNLLTDEQKVLFDMHAMKGKGGRGKGMI